MDDRPTKDGQQAMYNHPTQCTHSFLCLPSASDASEASEGFYNSVQAFSSQISVYTGQKEGMTISVLNASGNVHWVAVGFLLVAAVIQWMDTVKSNKEKYVDLLKRMMNLAKKIMISKGLPRLERETELYTTIKECISHKHTWRVKKVFSQIEIHFLMELIIPFQ
ncbi:hypothetical protein KI387_006857, partial [Taxus chinensis]